MSWGQLEGVERSNVASGIAASERSVFEDFEFFANSPNRIFILDALREDARSRNSLADEFSISRVTVKRVLDDLEERGWIEPSDPGYRATPLGEAVVGEVLALHSKLAALRKLQGLERWFPAQEDLDIRKFSDAEIVLPNRTTPLKPVDELCQVVSKGETIRAISSCPLGFSHLLSNWGKLFENCRAETVDLALTADVVDAVSSNQDHVATMSRLAETDGFRFRAYDEALSYSLALVDATVGLCLDDDQGFPRGTLITTDDDVRSWTESVFEDVWTDCRPVRDLA